jgi:NADP-dependent 3-hydroxy acid dehydrogenase YdfG
MSENRNRTAIITGAGSGIGQAIALAFAANGIDLVLAGRRLGPLEQVTEAVKGLGGTAISITTDVTDRASAHQLADRALSEFGGTDILVNNAGINTVKRNLRDITDEDWDRVIGINLTGAFNVFRAVMHQMEDKGSGLVINISSMAGKRAGTIGGTAYSASKFGVASLNQSINAEFRDSGVRATCIFPGEVDTPILDLRPNPVSQEKREAALHPDDIAAAALMVANLPERAIVEEITIFPRRAVAK